MRRRLKGATTTEHVQYHKDGSVWARDQTLDGQPTGCWEWFRKDGTKLKSGTFEYGQQVGDWTTYDKSDAVYKTTIKRRAERYWTMANEGEAASPCPLCRVSGLRGSDANSNSAANTKVR